MPSASVWSAASVRAGADRVADLPGLLGHTLDRGDRHSDHERDQAEDDEAGGQARLEPLALQDADERLERHRQHGGERHREHDLADRGEAGEHDDRRHHGPDEAPRPDPDARDPAQQAGAVRSRVDGGDRGGLVTRVAVVGEVSGLGHVPPPEVGTGPVCPS